MHVHPLCFEWEISMGQQISCTSPWTRHQSIKCWTEGWLMWHFHICPPRLIELVRLRTHRDLAQGVKNNLWLRIPPKIVLKSNITVTVSWVLPLVCLRTKDLSQHLKALPLNMCPAFCCFTWQVDLYCAGGCTVCLHYAHSLLILNLQPAVEAVKLLEIKPLQ